VRSGSGGDGGRFSGHPLATVFASDVVYVWGAGSAHGEADQPPAGQGDLNCGDFASQSAAQADLRRDPSDPHRLDKDGIACESNRAPFDRIPVRPAYSPRPASRASTTAPSGREGFLRNASRPAFNGCRRSTSRRRRLIQLRPGPRHAFLANGAAVAGTSDPRRGTWWI
jgi:hypothetical protein